MVNIDFKYDRLKENILHGLLIWTNNINNLLEEIKSINTISGLEYTEVSWTKNYEKNNLDRLSKVFNKYIPYESINDKKLYYVLLQNKYDKNIEYRIIDNNFKKITYNANYLIDKLANEIDNDLFFMSITENEFNALYYLIVGSQELENEIYSLPKKIDCDLQGHDTWESLSSVFRILNLSSEWVVLRNYEDLSDDYKFGPDDDIDILCRNIDIFTAIINAKKRTGGRCSYYVSVNNFNIPLDIRFIGDKYYDPVWQNNMIKTKVYYNNIPVLDMYNYFFALLYHIKLQKFFIKEAYIERLDNLADELNIKDLASKFIYDDKKCAELLNGFLLTNSYYYTYTDNARRNKFFLKYIKYVEINDLLDNYRVLIPSIIKVFMTKGFGKIKRLINKIIKKDINNAI